MEETVFQNTGSQMSKEEDFFRLEALYFSAKEEVAWGRSERSLFWE